MTYQDYFIPGSPLIICTFEPVPIGSFGDTINHDGEDVLIPHSIKRQVSEAEYYATVRPEYREEVKAKADPGALFYELSVD